MSDARPVFRSNRHGVVVVESWFAVANEANEPCDLLECRQLPEPLPDARSAPFDTIVATLDGDVESMFLRVKKDARRDIRRAEDTDGVHYTNVDCSPSELAKFLEFDRRFAARKRIATADAPRLEALAANHALALSRIAGRDGETLSWHVFVVAPERVRFLHGPSLAGTDDALRNLLGRANRYHHWHDMLRFKDAGIRFYDFGGWYGGTDNQAFARISRFKEEFGGTVRREYDSTRALTLKGRLYDRARRWLQPKQT